THTDWQKALGDMTWSGLPIRASTLGDIPGAAVPEFMPGMGTALQLRANYDIFRNRQIATARNDVQAAQAAREIAGLLTTAARTMSPDFEIRPSQVDFAVRDMLGGVGAPALGARQLLPGAEQGTANEPQRLPVVGGALQALGIRGTTGQSGTD